MSEPTKKDPSQVNTYKLYGTDPELEEHGTWVEFRPGVQYKIRSTLSKAVREFEHKLMKVQRPLYLANQGMLPLEQQDRNEITRCARAIIVDWRGQTDANGNPLPFTVENAERVMTDLPRLRNDVLFAASAEETFRRDMQQALEGNSEPTSAKS